MSDGSHISKNGIMSEMEANGVHRNGKRRDEGEWRSTEQMCIVGWERVSAAGPHRIVWRKIRNESRLTPKLNLLFGAII